MAWAHSGKGTSVGGTNKTLGTLISAATVKPLLYEIMLSCDTNPDDEAASFEIQRLTAVGTEGSGFTPTQLDPNAPASLCDCGVGVFSVEPTYTASSTIWSLSLNQRNSFRWVAARGRELIAPATASAGLGLRTVAATNTTPSWDWYFAWEE